MAFIPLFREKLKFHWTEEKFSFTIKKMRPKISFIIPAHNEENYIGNCLDFILKEISRENYPAEIIVVDNNSSDKTKEIASRYPNVKIVSEPIMGITRARQRGFLESHGKLICNIDADIKIPPGWLKTVLKEFKKDPKLVCLSGPNKFYDMPKSFRLLVGYYNLAMYATYIGMSQVLKIGSVAQGGNFIVKKEALEKIGGFNHHFNFYGEDTDIATRLHKIGYVKFTLKLPSQTSGRRFVKEGIIPIAFRYTVEYFWVNLFNEPFHKDYYKEVGSGTDKKQRSKLNLFKKRLKILKTKK